jgi:hypothetical protein
LSGDEERELLERAAAFERFRQLEELTTERLSEVSGEKGVDFATALLFDRVRTRHAEFIRELASGTRDERTKDRRALASQCCGVQKEYRYT